MVLVAQVIQVLAALSVLYATLGQPAMMPSVRRQTGGPKFLIPGEQYPWGSSPNAGDVWFGLVLSDDRSEFALRMVHVDLDPVDACGEGDFLLGRRVRVVEGGAVRFLVRPGSGLPDWRTGRVTTALNGVEFRPGTSRDMNTPAGRFGMVATGVDSLVGRFTDPLAARLLARLLVKDYELRLIDLSSGLSQVIVGFHPVRAALLESPEGAYPIPWVGDIDRDGRPDVVVDDRLGRSADHSVLYLSSLARPGELVHRSAEFFDQECFHEEGR